MLGATLYTFQDVGAIKHYQARTESECVLDKLIGLVVGRIHDDAINVQRSSFNPQKVLDKMIDPTAAAMIFYI